MARPGSRAGVDQAGSAEMNKLMRSSLSRWKAWYKHSVNRRIFAAILTVASFTVVVKLATVVKDVAVAAQFGVSDALDAFLIALVLPSFAGGVIAESLNPALIPTYIQVREHQGREAAQRLFSSVMVWSSVGLIAFSVVLALSAPYALPIIASGFSPEKLALTHSLFYVLLPILVLNGLGAIWAAVLNAGERFALTAIAPILIPITIFALVIAMGRVWGIYSLVPLWHGWDAATKQVLRQYSPIVAGAAMIGSTPLIDQSMAAMFDPGSVSVLNYAYKIVAGVDSIVTVALSKAVLPYFSGMVATNDWNGIRHTLKTYARLIF